MNESQEEHPDFTSPACDGLMLGDRAFDTDPTKILLESSDRHKLRYQLIQWLAEAPIREVKSERKRAIAETLDISTRQVDRLLKQYQEEQLSEVAGTQRSDKGKHRVGNYWQSYIEQVYQESLKKKHPLKPADVVREVQRHAVIDLRHEEGDHPHPATIYRILAPLVKEHKRKTKIRNPGAGSWLAVETRDGKLLRADYSNQIIQCDHTKMDIRIVDGDGKLLPWRPWLTTVVDTFSSCLVGYHLWHKQPGSEEVALTLRHAILPKRYPPEYDLTMPWDIYGPPLQYLFTDGGKELALSKQVQAIGRRLGFQCELRDRPPQGGIVERLFGTINTVFLASLPGYIAKGKTAEEKKKFARRAEKEAQFTLEDLDKLLADYFCSDYNRQPYPKDKRQTRYERWLQGMGNKLPEPLDEQDLYIAFMNGDDRVVQAHGSIYFHNLTYRCDELRSHRGKKVLVRYDPDHILTLYTFTKSTADGPEEFIGHAHAINMDTQDMSLDELKQLNQMRNTAKREHSNHSALVAQHKRNQVAEDKKQTRKRQQHSKQQKLRRKDKEGSETAAIRKSRGAVVPKASGQLELLPQRISPEQASTATAASSSERLENTALATPPQERHPLIVAKRQPQNSDSTGLVEFLPEPVTHDDPKHDKSDLERQGELPPVNDAPLQERHQLVIKNRALENFR